MSYIGNTSTTQAFTPAIDYFSGNASTTAFTLSKPVASVAQVQVVVNNVAQNPSSAYTVSGNTITFTSAPSAGTNNIYVYYTSPITQVIAPGQNTVYPSSLSTTNAVYWDTSGNVGIGTTSPIYPLQIGTAAAASSTISGIALRQGSGSPTAGNGYRVAWDNTQNVSSDFGSIFYGFGGGSAAAAGYMAFSTANAERMRIDGSGRVLINKTSTDGGQLNVQNSSTTTRAYVNATLRNSRTASTHYSVVSWNGSLVADAWIGQAPNTDALCFGHDAGTTIVESMRLQTSGELILGATAQVAQGKFGVAFVGSTHQAAAFNETSGAGSWTTVLFQRLGTTIGSISNATSSTAYNTSSDYRLKNTIAPMTGALAKVQALKPVTYKWNIDGEAGEGFIAHELAEVCPHAVTGAKDAVDENGNPVYQGIDTSFLVATLTAAIQEQQILITALTARITALENK